MIPRHQAVLLSILVIASLVMMRKLANISGLRRLSLLGILMRTFMTRLCGSRMEKIRSTLPVKVLSL